MNNAKVLLVEDNPLEIELIEDALEDARIIVDLTISRDGRQALDRLKAGLVPDMIWLDLAMPVMDGFELLKILKKSEAWRHIPVAILTSSSAEKDVLKAYRLQANCYLTKPPKQSEFEDLFSRLHGFWFQLVKIPGTI